MVLLDRILGPVGGHAVERLFRHLVAVDYFKRLLSLSKARRLELGLLNRVQVHLASRDVVELVRRRTVARGRPGIVIGFKSVFVVSQNGRLSGWRLFVLELLLAGLTVNLFGSVEAP